MGHVLKNPNKVSVDAEATLAGPLVLNLAFITYAITILNLLMPSQTAPEPAVLMLAGAATILTAATLTDLWRRNFPSYSPDEITKSRLDTACICLLVSANRDCGMGIYCKWFSGQKRLG